MENRTSLIFLVLLTFLFISSQSAPFSFTNYLRNRETEVASQKIDYCRRQINSYCTQCQIGYNLQQGKCFEVLQEPENVYGDQDNVYEDPQLGQVVDDDFIPCQGNSHCAESQGFRNIQDFEKFIGSYKPKQSLTIENNIALPMQNRRSFSAESVQFNQAASKRSVQPAQNRDFSGTNNQEENVDEADILKTDGTYIYTISNGVLSIIRAYPSRNIGLLSQINLQGLRPSAIFIEGDYLTVFGTKYQNRYQVYPSYKRLSYEPYYQPSQPYTFIKVYNVRNRARPTQIKSYEVEGRYFNGRKTQNGYVYLLTTTRIYQRQYIMPWYNFGGRQLYFPYSNIFYYPGRYTSPLFVSIFTFDLSNPYRNTRGISCLITENAHNIYMSEKAIYITHTDYSRGSDSSVIHKVYVNRNRIIPFADARIKGRINNQFSMDQYRQVLRVATTQSSGGSSSNVYCLDYFLNEIGWLKGIAPSERIFSARFVDRRLYLVTFRQIDPFFVISFQNHRRPKILGELKITGFSRYLHPYDQDTIIGLGRQADSNGRQQGLKISLFDVSNVRSPVQAASFQFEERYASSTAQWEHKAFLLSKSNDLMVIPGRMNNKDVKFNGAFVFYIDQSTIKLKGIVDHLISDEDQFYKRGVERSLYIEQLLYTKSQCLLRVNKLNNLADVRDVEIPCEAPQVIRPSPIPKPIPRPLPIAIQPRPILKPIYRSHPFRYSRRNQI